MYSLSLDPFLIRMSQLVALDASDKELLQQCLSVKQYKQKERLLREGQISPSFFYVLSGFIRLYYLREGSEITAYFYPPDTFVSAYESYVKQIPSRFNLQACAESIVVEIRSEAAVRLLNHSAKFEAIARMAMEDELIAHQRIIEGLLTLSPEERYYQLMQDNPGIFQQVPQHQIASYIGVKPESLSRIKKRALSRKS